MSGGSWEYIYYKFQETADRLKQEHATYRKAFGILIERIASAMHDIEWADSADISEEEAKKSVMKLLSKKDLLQATLESARSAQKELTEAIKECKNERR